ncbi:hypothetical protein [Vibrio splendidus]|uniref:hypothetical protein n=1 Tax=Vibrio splendidus TaxID=29497 RepID=UPI00035C9EA7|nr:hypothetical protein [Vibrio splendidus]OEE54086.1 hypothetical protein A146_13375 [Vibrio splendidus FF-500]
MPVHQLILNFQQFMLACWPQLNQVMQSLDWDNDPYFVDNWIQANWELMVEKQLGIEGVILLPYGYDISPSSRYTRKGASATHRVICKLKDMENSLAFLSFISKAEGELKLEPPFDNVCVKNLDTNETTSWLIDDIEFFIDKIG